MSRAALLMAWTSVALFVALACAESHEPAHVVVITLDTTRVDHLSAYGYARETSPNLDAFARTAVRYTRAWSTYG